MTKPQKKKALERIKRSLDKIEGLRGLSTSSPEFEKWQRNTEVAIENTFGANSRHKKDFTSIHYTPMVYSFGGSDPDWQTFYESGLDSATSILGSMIEEIDVMRPEKSGHGILFN